MRQRSANRAEICHNPWFGTAAISASITIEALYLSVLGRPADPGGLAAAVAAVDAGATTAQIQIGLADSPEAQADLEALYQSVLGRAADPGGLASWTQALATGTSLAQVRADLASSREAAGDINALYQSVLGRSVDPGGFSNAEQALASGTSLATLRSDIAASPEAQSDLKGLYQTELGRAADAGGLATFTQALAGGASLATVTADLANSAEAVGDIDTAWIAATGAPPNAVELAADQSELQSGLSLSLVQAEIAELDGGAAPHNGPAFATITPETLAGGTPDLVYALLNNDALIAPAAENVSVTYYGASGQGMIQGFNPATDILQIQTQQDAGFANLTFFNFSPDVAVILGHGAEIILTGVSSSQLHAANFRFV